MNRNWYLINVIFILLILGGIILAVIEYNINYFLSCFSIGISILIVYCSSKQNQIQQNNIKIQLFDKRYQVFQSILDTITIIKRDNWDRYLLFNENDINKQMILIEESLYKSVQLSACLFDNNLHTKLVAVNNAFCNVTIAYKNMITASLENINDSNKAQEYKSILNSHIFSNKGLNSKDYENELKEKFPNVYINLMEFSKECDSYITFITKNDIIKEISKYVDISKSDR